MLVMARVFFGGACGSATNPYKASEAVAVINRSGTVQREAWRFENDVFLRHTVDINAELEYIVNWIEPHMTYLDDYVFTTEHFVRGDVDRSGAVDVDDLNELVNMIIGLKPINAGGDLNRDQLVDIDDINEVVNIILNLDFEEPTAP